MMRTMQQKRARTRNGYPADSPRQKEIVKREEMNDFVGLYTSPVIQGVNERGALFTHLTSKAINNEYIKSKPIRFLVNR